MLPTMERCPRRSRYSSATRQSFLAGRACLPLVGCPVASSSATRVSPRSTLTNTCFLKRGFLSIGQDAALECRGGPALRIDRLQQAEGQQSCDDRTAAIAHERQWDAGDRRDPDGHPDVDEDLEHQHRDDAPGDQRTEQVLRQGEYSQTAPD